MFAKVKAFHHPGMKYMFIMVLDIKALECSQTYSHQLHLFEISATYSNGKTQNNQILHYCRTLDLDWLLLDTS